MQYGGYIKLTDKDVITELDLYSSTMLDSIFSIKEDNQSEKE